MVSLARARHLRIEHSGDVVAHFSPRRTSRTVVYRSTARVGACRVVSAHAADPRSPGRLNDATLTVSGRNQSILTNVFASFQTQARAALTRIYGPSAVPAPGTLIALRCPRTGQSSDYRSAMHCFGRALPTIPLRISFATTLSRKPKTLFSRKLPSELREEIRRIAGWHRL